MKAKTNNQNMFLRIISSPIRALAKARDFYVRSITDCSNTVGHGSIAVHAAPLPRSYSSNSSRSSNDHNDDFEELVRAASSKSIVDFNLYVQQELLKAGVNSTTGSRKMPRSSSVAMAKIDEDKPYTFGDEDDDNVDIKMVMKYPRSRSYAVHTKRNGVF